MSCTFAILNDYCLRIISIAPYKALNLDTTAVATHSPQIRQNRQERKGNGKEWDEPADKNEYHMDNIWMWQKSSMTYCGL